jgi:hypothetical protein
LCRGALLSIVVLGLVVFPWTVRNYFAFQRFVLLNTNAGFAFYWGNHPIHGTDFVPILSSYGELIPEDLRALNEADMDRALLQLGLKSVLEEPVRYVLLSLSRFREYFKFWPSSASSDMSNLSRVLSFGLFLPFFIGGILLSLIRAKTYNLKPGVSLILIFAAGYTIIHLLTWTLIRYRLPVDALLISFAGLALSVMSARLLDLVPSGRFRLESLANQKQG